MDGNFIDNDIESLIESASVLPQLYTDTTNGDKPTNLKNKYDKFSLRIKFSSSLDPNSVTDENAVLLSGKNKIKTAIDYDSKRTSIIIKPKSRYLRNRLYILRISGKIMTEKGRSLRKHMFYAFKQDGSKLSFYRGIAGQPEKAPSSLPIPRNYLLPMLFTASACILVASYFYNYSTGLIAGAVIVLIAVVAAMIDSASGFGKSHKEYIYGAKLYNQGYYYDALECFERALHYNSENAFAKYALDAAILKSSEGG